MVFIYGLYYTVVDETLSFLVWPTKLAVLKFSNRQVDRFLVIFVKSEQNFIKTDSFCKTTTSEPIKYSSTTH